jgi:hypothetical protein
MDSGTGIHGLNLEELTGESIPMVPMINLANYAKIMIFPYYTKLYMSIKLL